MKGSNLSQELFEDYLNHKGLVKNRDYFYEPDGNTRPDFLVKAGHNIIFEVKEFSSDSEGDQQLRSLEGHVTVLELYGPVRRKIQKAKRQFKSHKNDYPCVLILYKGDSLAVNLDIFVVAAAAYGDLSMNSNGQWHFGQNTKLSPERNKTFSGIGIIDEVYPERVAAHKIFLEDNTFSSSDTLQQIDERFKDWSQVNGYNLEKRVIRVQLINNVFASKHVSLGFFDGECDEIYSTDENGLFGRMP